jgi:radical SAM superfamily enzyme YgiQ (UPF0313 family)
MITLINPPGIKTFSGLQMHTPNPPLGLAYVAGTLRAAGIPYRVVDATGEALDAVSPYPDRSDFMVQGLTLDEILARVHPDSTVIGISCMFSTLWPLTNRVAHAVRDQFPRALLVLGGEHGTAVPEHVLSHSPFDVVVLGEGEETFVELVRAHAEGRPLASVKGLALREGGSVVTTGLSARRRDVDAIPLPDWDSFPIGEYIARHQVNGINLGRSMPILGTRGCPFQCTFCSNPGMWTQRWIPRDPRALADEMALYVRKYAIRNFDFQDLTAIVKRRWIVDFCRELIRRDLGVTWQMPSGTRAEVFDAEVADLLYRSGCRALAFAPESGAPEILKTIKKQVDLDHMLTAMRAAVRRGLKLSCFIVIGFPDDTPATLRQTLRLVRRMAVLGVHDIAVSKFVPYPGSALFRRLQREGKLQLDDQFFVSPMDFYTARAPSYADAVSSRRLYWTMVWMFVNFYVTSFTLRPWRVVRALVRALVTGTEETRYAKWFVDVVYTRRRWRKLAGGVTS